jgi:hypothetical protein
MGFSTPKTPFNLADFLSQKGTPRSSRKPAWSRRPARSANDDSMVETAADPSDLPTEAEPKPQD